MNDWNKKRTKPNSALLCGVVISNIFMLSTLKAELGWAELFSLFLSYHWLSVPNCLENSCWLVIPIPNMMTNILESNGSCSDLTKFTLYDVTHLCLQIFGSKITTRRAESSRVFGRIFKWKQGRGAKAGWIIWMIEMLSASKSKAQ